jgi:hypothetical protein
MELPVADGMPFISYESNVSCTGVSMIFC